LRRWPSELPHCSISGRFVDGFQGADIDEADYKPLEVFTDAAQNLGKPRLVSGGFESSELRDVMQGLLQRPIGDRVGSTVGLEERFILRGNPLRGWRRSLRRNRYCLAGRRRLATLRVTFRPLPRRDNLLRRWRGSLRRNLYRFAQCCDLPTLRVAHHHANDHHVPL